MIRPAIPPEDMGPSLPPEEKKNVGYVYTPLKHNEFRLLHFITDEEGGPDEAEDDNDSDEDEETVWEIPHRFPPDDNSDDIGVDNPELRQWLELTGWYDKDFRSNFLESQREADTGSGTESSSTSLQEDNDEEGRPMIRCTLETFTVESAPGYRALSWAWGGDTGTQDIYLDKHRYALREHLHQALISYRDVYIAHRDDHPSVEYLWIDAICIDQANQPEKEFQIPLMSTIYSRAFRVIAWLGVPTNVPTEEMNRILVGMSAVSEYSRENNILYEESLQLWGEPSHPFSPYPYGHFRAAILGLAQQPWWQRVWIAQEAAMAVNNGPDLLCGGAFPRFFGFWDMSLTMRHFGWVDPGFTDLEGYEVGGGEEEPMLRVSPASRPRPFLKHDYGYHGQAYILLRDVYQQASQYAESEHQAELKLLRALLLARPLHATEDHDRIYGILGMTGWDKPPEKLLPAYDIPFAEVAYTYTTFLLEKTCDLRILHLGRLGRFPGQPSWVSDFRDAAGELTYENSPWARRANYMIRYDGRVLETSAILLGKCAHILQPINPGSSSSSSSSESLGEEADQTFLSLAAAFMKFEEEIIARAAEKGQRPRWEVREEWLKSRLILRMHYDERCNLDQLETLTPLVAKAYLTHYFPTVIRASDCAADFIPPGFDPDAAHEETRHFTCLFQDRDFQHILLRPAFVMEDGRIGALRQEDPLHEGDVLYLLPGLLHPAVLRPQPGGNYRVVGMGHLDKHKIGYAQEDMLVFTEFFARSEDPERFGPLALVERIRLV